MVQKIHSPSWNNFNIAEREPVRILHFFEILWRCRQIHFVRYDVPWALRQYRIVQTDFAPKVSQVFDRIPSFAAGKIDNEKQDAATRNVAQEIATESEITMGAFDQTRDVRYCGALVTWKFHYPNDRMQGRERICRDFRARGRDPAQKRRFARIWISNQARVRDRSQLK